MVTECQVQGTMKPVHRPLNQDFSEELRGTHETLEHGARGEVITRDGASGIDSEGKCALSDARASAGSLKGSESSRR